MSSPVFFTLVNECHHQPMTANQNLFLTTHSTHNLLGQISLTHRPLSILDLLLLSSTYYSPFSSEMWSLEANRAISPTCPAYLRYSEGRTA